MPEQATHTHTHMRIHTPRLTAASGPLLLELRVAFSFRPLMTDEKTDRQTDKPELKAVWVVEVEVEGRGGVPVHYDG